jgi:hypothetical protein
MLLAVIAWHVMVCINEERGMEIRDKREFASNGWRYLGSSDTSVSIMCRCDIRASDNK